MSTRHDELEALSDEHCYIKCVDSCCHCGDQECDGISCIASLDPDDDDDLEAIEDLHAMLRDGQAWRAMQRVIDAGEQPLVAWMLANDALANANNMTVTETCEECGRQFLAHGPCDDMCTPCRLFWHFHPSGLDKESWFAQLARTLAWDFDGTIHPYTAGWTGSTPDDEPPIEGVRETLQELADRGFRQVIFSTRCDHDDGLAGVKAWLAKYELDHFFDDVTCQKPAALAYIDDRAVPYHGNWEDVKIRINGLAKGRPHGAAPQ